MHFVSVWCPSLIGPPLFYRLKKAGIPVRLVTNETCSTRKVLVDKLLHHNFSICEADIFSPVPAVISVLKERGLSPHLLVHPDVSLQYRFFPRTW